MDFCSKSPQPHVERKDETDRVKQHRQKNTDKDVWNKDTWLDGVKESAKF